MINDTAVYDRDDHRHRKDTIAAHTTQPDRNKEAGAGSHGGAETGMPL